MEDPHLRAIASHAGVSIFLLFLIYESESYVMGVANGYTVLAAILLIFGYISRGFTNLLCIDRRITYSDVYVISVVEAVLVFFALCVALIGNIDRADEHGKQFRGLLGVIVLDAVFWYTILYVRGVIDHHEKAKNQPAKNEAAIDEKNAAVNSATVSHAHYGRVIEAENTK
jgi:hypothetical protein